MSCSLYSLSSANVELPGHAVDGEITGKTTLMACAVTPRVLVLAWLTGVGVDVDADEAATGTTAAPAPSGDPGVPDGARVSQTIRPTTTAEHDEHRADLHGTRAVGASGASCARSAAADWAASSIRLAGGVLMVPSPSSSLTGCLRSTVRRPVGARTASVRRPRVPRRSRQGRPPGPAGRRAPPRVAHRPPPVPAP